MSRGRVVVSVLELCCGWVVLPQSGGGVYQMVIDAAFMMMTIIRRPVFGKKLTDCVPNSASPRCGQKKS
eukprot:scaffold244_cov172-Amphora_coffeaeformis.AAC.68